MFSKRFGPPPLKELRELWCYGVKPQGHDERDVSELHHRLGVLLPEDYLRAIRTTGPLWSVQNSTTFSPAFDHIYGALQIAQELDDLEKFHTAPFPYVPVATHYDDLFVFRKSDLAPFREGQASTAEAPLYIFDNAPPLPYDRLNLEDLLEPEPVAPSFYDWTLTLLKAADPDRWQPNTRLLKCSCDEKTLKRTQVTLPRYALEDLVKEVRSTQNEPAPIDKLVAEFTQAVGGELLHCQDCGRLWYRAPDEQSAVAFVPESAGN